MKVARIYPEIFFRIGRLRFYRFGSFHREILVQWSDGREPECFRTLFRLFGCWHLKRFHWRDERFGVEGSNCVGCMKLFDYRLTEREIFRKFLTRNKVWLYRKTFLFSP